MSMQTREQMLFDLERKAYLDLIAQARAEGERAGRIAGKLEMREMAARHIDKRWLTNASQSETVLLKELAADVRSLKVEGE